MPSEIIRRLEEANNKRLHDLQDNEDYIKFVCLVNGEREEVVAYNQIVDHIEADQTFDGIWKYKEILDHKKVKPSEEDYRGSRYNLLIEWETGERTWEPLTTADKKGIYDLDRVTVAIYARQNKLLDEQDGAYQACENWLRHRSAFYVLPTRPSYHRTGTR